MSDNIEHRIQITLNSAGWTGDEVGALVPDFEADRPTWVGLQWAPSANGPESYAIAVFIGATAVVAKEFLSELGKDLYKWAKLQFLPIVERKRCPHGFVDIKVGRSSVSAYLEDSTYLADLFSQLPELISQTESQPGVCDWEIEYDLAGGRWSTRPAVED